MKCQVVGCINPVPRYPEPTGFHGIICNPHLKEASEWLRERYLNAVYAYGVINFSTPEQTVRRRAKLVHETGAEIANELKSGKGKE